MRAVSSMDEISIGPFRIKLTLLGTELSDGGFGDGSDVSENAATQVRRVDQTQPPEARDGWAEQGNRPSTSPPRRGAVGADHPPPHPA